MTKIVSLTLKISTDKEIGEPGNGGNYLDGLNERDKMYLRQQMNGFSDNITKTCEGIGMLHSASNKSTVFFRAFFKSEDSRIAVKIGHYKIKK